MAKEDASVSGVWAKDESVRKQSLTPVLLTAEAFAPYGEVIVAENRPDFRDITLNLREGTPRFYLMALEGAEYQRMRVEELTRHKQTTQVLGSIAGPERGWYMAVCPPSPDRDVPDLQQLQVFYVPGSMGIKLSEGNRTSLRVTRTWHDGPLFVPESAEQEEMIFYNLELMDTNIKDHESVRVLDRFGLAVTFCEYVGEGSSKRKKD